jgi:hypothetical protein
MRRCARPSDRQAHPSGAQSAIRHQCAAGGQQLIPPRYSFDKWRFFDGQASFTASTGDEDFLRSVDNGNERFGKGDVLVVTMRVQQVRTALIE